MTEVSTIGGASPSLTGAQTGLADNFEMFLTLLTEQMKNQDPLEPLDSSQFVNQLVDFSSVEQQISQNQNLESLLVLQSASAQLASVGYIGREATANTPQTSLSNGSANWSYTNPQDASTTSLTIKDEGGRVVARFNGETGSGIQDFQWDGKDSNGSQMADGVYSLEVLSVDGDGANIAAEIQASARVTGINLSGSEVIVEMGAIRVPLSSVVSVQEVASST
jgi:flagellar basal-body rod modification protein FlgD